MALTSRDGFSCRHGNETIGVVAGLAGTAVRTLRHYDDISLLCPSERSDNGYRTYTDVDIGRLQQILTYRELAFGLDEIRAILDESVDTVLALQSAPDRIRKRIVKLESIAMSLEGAIESETKGTVMQAQDKLEVFGDFDPESHADEVEQRWGNTDLYVESARRTNSYTFDNWKRYHVETNEIYARLLVLMRGGVPAHADETVLLVNEQRAKLPSGSMTARWRSTQGWERWMCTTSGFGRTSTKLVTDSLSICHKRLLLGTSANSAGWVCSAPTPFGCAASP